MLKISRSEKKDYTRKDVLFVPYKGYYFVLNLFHVTHVKSDSSYCIITMCDGKEFVVASSIKLILNKLPDYFIRTHHSYIVNLFHAASIHGGSVIRLNNNSEVPISRRKKREIFEAVSTIK